MSSNNEAIPHLHDRLLKTTEEQATDGSALKIKSKAVRRLASSKTNV
jgi:hypothetical protein